MLWLVSSAEYVAVFLSVWDLLCHVLRQRLFLMGQSQAYLEHTLGGVARAGFNLCVTLTGRNGAGRQRGERSLQQYYCKNRAFLNQKQGSI